MGAGWTGHWSGGGPLPPAPSWKVVPTEQDPSGTVTPRYPEAPSGAPRSLKLSASKTCFYLNFLGDVRRAGASPLRKWGEVQRGLGEGGRDDLVQVSTQQPLPLPTPQETCLGDAGEMPPGCPALWAPLPPGLAS